MKIVIQSPGPLEAEKFETKDDKVEAVPFFYGKGNEGIAAVMRVFTNDGKLLRAARLVICGVTGKLSVQDRSEPVKAAMERSAELGQPQSSGASNAQSHAGPGKK